jgi:hypothetical protein
MKYFLSLIILLATVMIIEGENPKFALIEVSSEEMFELDLLTIYNPVQEQTDSDPLVTASMKKIDLEKLIRSEIRWMALSRDMLQRWGGKIQYGDTIRLDADDPDIDGLWVVYDTMNKRYTRTGDLLFHQNTRTKGKWKNVKMFKKINRP